MRIIAINEAVIPIGAPMRNASIAFGAMTASAVAILTDRKIDGSPLVGFAFDSIGRYAKGGLLRERFIPRLLAAVPETLLDPDDGLIDPDACWICMMADEKDGGHGERPGAVGLLDAARARTLMPGNRPPSSRSGPTSRSAAGRSGPTGA